MDIFSILLAILLFGLMIFFHELGHFATAKWAGVKVNEFSIGMGPAIVSLKKGDTAYSLRLFPIGGFVAMEGEDEESSDEHCFMACPVWKRIIITSAGGIMNIILGLALVAVLTNGMELLGTRYVAGFEENAATAKYLETGDEIISVNGEKTKSYNDIIYSMIRDEDGVMSMDVVRNGKEIHLDDVRFNKEDKDDGAKSIILDFSFYGVRPTFLGKVKYSFDWTISLIKLVWHSLADIVTDNFTLNKLSGPIGVTEIISETAHSKNYDDLIFIVALITINLGVFNLIPLPALDGGRIFFMIIELIRGKPINQKAESMIHTAGMALLMALAIYVAYNDIVKIVLKG